MAICCPQGRDTLRQKLFSSHYVDSKLSHSSTKAVSKFSQRSPKNVLKMCLSSTKVVLYSFGWIHKEGMYKLLNITISLAPTRVFMVQSTNCQASLPHLNCFSLVLPHLKCFPPKDCLHRCHTTRTGNYAGEYWCKEDFNLFTHPSSWQYCSLHSEDFEWNNPE